MIGIVFCLLMMGVGTVKAEDINVSQQQENVDAKDIVFGHIQDSYEWHITKRPQPVRPPASAGACRARGAGKRSFHQRFCTYAAPQIQYIVSDEKTQEKYLN